MKKSGRASKVLDNLTVNMGKMEMGHHSRASHHIAQAQRSHNQVLGFLSTTKIGKAARKRSKRPSHLDTVHL